VQMIIQTSMLDAVRLLVISTISMWIGLRKSVEKFQRNCSLSNSFAGHTQSMALWALASLTEIYICSLGCIPPDVLFFCGSCIFR
jgi:hypothetical protein